MHPPTNNPRALIAYLLISALPSWAAAVREAPVASKNSVTITITSPQAGSIVIAGQLISVSIESGTGTSLQKVAAWILPLSDIPKIKTSPPYQFQVKVPEEEIGPATLMAVGIDQDGNRLEHSISITVDAPAAAKTVQALPDELLFTSVGEILSIDIACSYPDGIRRYVTRSRKTTYASTNSKVASVSSEGEVKALAPGTGSISINHAGLSAVIPVYVGIHELRGDLDGDGDVDSNDVKILTDAIGSPASGVGDPRDLNNDGILDARDLEALRLLCTRTGCAAETKCTFALSPSTATIAAAGGTGTISITANAADCAWTAASNVGWLTITSKSAGTGSGTVEYAAAANDSDEGRMGTIALPGPACTVTQEAKKALPDKAILISPSGTVATANPTYKWNAVASASWYLLWVDDSKTTAKINQWYKAADAGCDSGTGTCAVTPGTTLDGGACHWWIQTWNLSGYGPWSDGISFTVSAGGVPGKTTLVSPSGTITTATPPYIWNAVSNATWYYLWINDGSDSPKIQTWYTAAQAGCATGNGTCSIIPAGALPGGSYRWWVQTWNDNGYGPWSDPLVFHIPPNAMRKSMFNRIRR